MLPLIVNALRTHSLADICATHGLKASQPSHKVAVNYDQIAAREDDPLARECRGLILATADGTTFPTDRPVPDVLVFARSFDRFFNHGQGHAAELQLSDPQTRVFEKLDGTLCNVYYDRAAYSWCIATRSVPDADRPVNGFGDHTFASLFRDALRATAGIEWEELIDQLDPEHTYAFELTAPHNRVVVKYDEPRIHLLALRHTSTGIETCPLELSFPVPVAPSHLASDIDALLTLVGARPPQDSEGVVVRMAIAPGRFARVKVKSVAYVAATKLRESAGSGSPRSLLELLLLDRYDDVAPLLPPYQREHGDRLRDRLVEAAAAFDAAYSRIAAETAGDINPRKALALAAKRDDLWIGPVMERYTGRCDSFLGFLRNANRDGAYPDAFLDNVLERIGGIHWTCTTGEP